MARNDLIREAAWALINRIAHPKRKATVLVICGLHNKWFAEALMLASHRVGAEPHVWIFDEDSFAKNLEATSEKTVPTVPHFERSLLEKSDVVIWLSQFDYLKRFPKEVRGIAYAFWDGVYDSLKAKLRLLVNLPSARFVEDIGVDYDRFVRVFVDGIRVDYDKLGRSGLIVSRQVLTKTLFRRNKVGSTFLLNLSSHIFRTLVFRISGTFDPLLQVVCRARTVLRRLSGRSLVQLRVFRLF